MAESRSISSATGNLHYYKAGHGLKVVLLYHGAGQHHRPFPFIDDPQLHTQFTFFSFDLPFHGNSTWISENPISKRDWKIWMDQFLKKESIIAFDILAYSIGARFGLATAEAFPSKTKRLLLLAPDGLHPNIWYSIATSTRLFRWIFHKLMDQYLAFLFINRASRTLGLVNPRESKWIENQLSTPEKRNRIYNSWVYFRHLKFRLHTLITLFNDHTMAVTIAVGNKDGMVNRDNLRKFCHRLRGSTFREVEATHTSILKECLPILLSQQKVE